MFWQNQRDFISIFLFIVYERVEGIIETSLDQKEEVFNFYTNRFFRYFLDFMRIFEGLIIIECANFIHQLILFTIRKNILNFIRCTLMTIISFFTNPSLKLLIILVFKSEKRLFINPRAISYS